MADITLSFAARILNPSKAMEKCFQDTVDEYQKVVSWLVPVAAKHWDEIQVPPKANERRSVLESLVHATEDNPEPPYARFDEEFPNLPSYLRRAALTAAIGDVSSWKSNHENWVEGGRKGHEPKLAAAYHQSPAFYKTNMWRTVKVGEETDSKAVIADSKPTKEERAAKAAKRAENKASQGERKTHPKWAKYQKTRKRGGKGEAKAASGKPQSVATAKRDWGNEGSEDFTRALIKVRQGKAWVWCLVHLRPDQAWKIKEMSDLMRRCAPTLEKRGKAWFLRFAFEKRVQLTDAPVGEQRICAVDLGVNTPATCCVMEPDGTVVARSFIDFPTERGHLDSNVNRLRKAQSKGSRRMPRKWRRINHLNEEISRRTARAIVDLAIEYSCTHVVFEHLGNIGGKKRGSRKWRLHLWRARDVQARVERHAHLWGMRISRVCAWGTSRLAFDGSGRVRRGREITPRAGRSFGYGWVEFSSGKLYAADLNAAYNIGARFFIRALLKALPAKVESRVLAKVPRCEKRSSCVLSDLISLAKAIAGEAPKRTLTRLGLAC